jgi:hypothetical protein
MIGNNRMNLNQATMVKALQEFFDRRWTAGGGEKPIKVVSVSEHPGNANVFRVYTSDGQES